MRKKRVFCKFHEHCYFSDGIGSESREKAAILQGRSGSRCYVLTLAANPDDQLDIINSMFLRSPRYMHAPVMIYGVAESKEDAINLAARIFDDAEHAGMPGNARKYLEELL